MTWLQTAEFKVGTLVVIVGSLIAFMSMQVSDDPSYLGRSKKAWFLLNNAGGLIKNSAVKSAGIPVGVIKDIRLQDGKARIDVTIQGDMGLTTSAYVEIKAQGILGDAHVEIYPGSPTDPPLEDGAQILRIKDGGSLDKLITKVSDITDSLKDVSDALKEAVTEDGTQKHILGRIVSNIENISADLKDVTGRNREKLNDIVDQIHDVTESLSSIAKDDSEKGLNKTWNRLSKVTKDLEEITDKINKGEGTVGKLINDDTTVEELNTTLQGVSQMMDSAKRVQTGFDFQGQYLNEAQATKSYIGVRIQPGLDRYYYLAIVDDPAGVVETTKTATSGTSTADVTERRTFMNKTKMTLLFAKNFWDLSVKAGLIENTGGFGVDYSFWKRKFKFSLEAFDFGTTNVRTSLNYNFYHGLYLNTGVSDMLNSNNARSAFVGAGLYLTNDDLKLLLTRSPF